MADVDHDAQFDFVAKTDFTASLSSIASAFHQQHDRIYHFFIRYDHLLPIVLSQDEQIEYRIAAAYLCHEPYRRVTADVDLHPFRSHIEACSRLSTNAALTRFLDHLIHLPSRDLDQLASLPLAILIARCGSKNHLLASSREADLLLKATQQTLSMAEQRALLSWLRLTVDERVSRLDDLISASALSSIAVHHPILTTELLIQLCSDALLTTSNELEDRDRLQRVRPYFEALSSISPSMRSFDLITRLLRCDAPAPAPLRISPLRKDVSGPVSNIKLQTTVAHLARLYTLGSFLSHAIAVLEHKESEVEAQIVADLHDSGLDQLDRRQVDLRLEDSMARQVGAFCHFISSLVNAALIFPPDLGSLKRQIADLSTSDTNADTSAVLGQEINNMELDLQSMTEATLIELKHFALRFGRYRDGTRLYSELNDLSVYV